MGYHMAINLRNKIDKAEHMIIADTNNEACEMFLKESSEAGPTKVVKNAREAIEEAVSLYRPDY